jgi:alpha-ketoglutarate-dependent taurine dioxygenase
VSRKEKDMALKALTSTAAKTKNLVESTMRLFTTVLKQEIKEFKKAELSEQLNKLMQVNDQMPKLPSNSNKPQMENHLIKWRKSMFSANPNYKQQCEDDATAATAGIVSTVEKRKAELLQNFYSFVDCFTALPTTLYGPNAYTIDL